MRKKRPSDKKRLARCEERLRLLETAIVANAKVWKAWVKAVSKK